jgi:hypothetical protein
VRKVGKTSALLPGNNPQNFPRLTRVGVDRYLGQRDRGQEPRRGIVRVALVTPPRRSVTEDRWPEASYFRVSALPSGSVRRMTRAFPSQVTTSARVVEEPSPRGPGGSVVKEPEL